MEQPLWLQEPLLEAHWPQQLSLQQVPPQLFLQVSAHLQLAHLQLVQQHLWGAAAARAALVVATEPNVNPASRPSKGSILRIGNLLNITRND
ncbi:MAG: hypothetical protein JWN98_225 [Abditibacteriota bacterium]|nr:hypothetical protein [Abditibacteriota bacterium]